MPRTLRGRLVLASALATFLAIAALGATVAVVVGHQLHASLDRTLRDRAGDVARLAASAPALLTAPGALEAPLGGRELSVEVVDGRGRIVARSASLGGRVLPGGALQDAAIRAGRSGIADARLGDEPIRLYVAPIADAGGPAAGGAVLVASSTGEISGTLHHIRVLLLVGALAAAALGAFAAAVLTGRGLRPLRRLAAGAGEIERAADPGRRLPERRVADELGELTETLNRMLAALERARETERRFLADASHELRTPLTALRGNAAYVARHGADPDALADLEADAARLGRLLDDLLVLEREEGAGRPHEPVALADLAAQAVAAEPQAVVVAAEPVAVLGDRGALARALENLIANARVHGPPGGRIAVEVRAAGGRARLSVTDEGPGLQRAEAEAAFTRFWRGGSSTGRPGSGLGLAIVRSTAERHGGQVQVDGARFTIDLPAVREVSESRSSVAAS